MFVKVTGCLFPFMLLSPGFIVNFSQHQATHLLWTCFSNALSSHSLSTEISPHQTQRNEKFCLESLWLMPLSHHKLWDLFARQIQGKVFVGSLDRKGVLLAHHAGPLISQARVAAAAAAVTQLLGAAERVAVGSVLAELCPLQAVFLVKPDVVQRLAVPVSRRLGLSASRCLEVRSNNLHQTLIK